MDIEQILQIPKARIKLMLAGVGGIVFFYTIFKPFQMALYDWGDYVFVNVSYALISLVVLSFHLVVFPKYFEQRYLRLISSTRGRLFFLVWVLFVIGFLFFVFKISFGYYALTWARVSTGILAFLVVGFHSSFVFTLPRIASSKFKHKLLLHFLLMNGCTKLPLKTCCTCIRIKTTWSGDACLMVFCKNSSNVKP